MKQDGVALMVLITAKRNGDEEAHRKFTIYRFLRRLWGRFLFFSFSGQLKMAEQKIGLPTQHMAAQTLGIGGKRMGGVVSF